MHEASLVQALIDRVESEARSRGALAVSRVRVSLGAAAGVERELFELAYATFRERTVCAGAELEVVEVPARWACPDCGGEPAAGAALRCPACARPLRLVAGDELTLEQIELEVA